ncbi:MAG: acyl-CoA dehydrogenase family protein [Nitriliruptorales bacterium]|nr:acyl-CoA dehydrogenase family protein [Nitriliruptorales bacterium]
MDFEWSEDQLLLRDSVRDFASRLDHDVMGHDAGGIFPMSAWKRCAEFGIQALAVPNDYGGTGASPLSLVLAMEALGYGCRDSGLLFALNAQMWACQHPIVQFGSEEQKQRYLPRFADGSLIGSHAMSEPGSGSDAFSLSTTAERHGEKFVINGSKTFVTNAPAAGLFVLFARTDTSETLGGLTAFLVERDVAGLSVGRPLQKMGLRTAPMSEVFLSDCVVPANSVLGGVGGGMMVFNEAMELERSLILACTVGIMERNLERCVTYARERRQFNRSIAKFQAVSHRIAEMKVRLETSRLLLYRLGWKLERGHNVGLDSALVKLHLSESYLASSLEALQVHGGYGYMSEYEFERDVRDAIGSRLYSGTSDMQRNLIARHLSL